MTGRARTAAYDLYLVVVNLLLALPSHHLRLLVLGSIGRASIGAGTSVERGLKLTTKGGIVIGRRCSINARALLDGRGGLTIGDLVNISPDVTILTAEHDPDSPHFEGVERAVTIGDRVWLASRAMVLPGSSVGTGAVVGAGAVVRGAVEPWTIVAGNPARFVERRDPAAQESLLRYRRWFH